MTFRVGVVGSPVAHSLSPVMMQAAFDELAIEARYELWDVSAGGLGQFVESLRSPGTLGCNVTTPYKSAVLEYVDDQDELVRSLGAANTIVCVDGGLVAHNTDVAGFLSALEREHSFPVRGAKCVVVGAGGSARAVVHALCREGAQRVTILNRTVGRAEGLVDEMEATPGSKTVLQACDLGGSQAAKAVVESELLVNCTTVGMAGGPEAEGCPVAPDWLSSRPAVYDLVYMPLETPLVLAARQHGCVAAGGLLMLVFQAAAAFELWTGRPAPVAVMERAVRSGRAP